MCLFTRGVAEIRSNGGRLKEIYYATVLSCLPIYSQLTHVRRLPRLCTMPWKGRAFEKKKMFAAKPNATCGILRADTVSATWMAWKLQFQSFVASEMGFNILHMLSCSWQPVITMMEEGWKGQFSHRFTLFRYQLSFLQYCSMLGLLQATLLSKIFDC